MHLNTKLLQLLGLRFADENYDIDFDDYLTCIIRLENMFSEYQGTVPPYGIYLLK
jgi:calpain-9